MRSKNKRVFLLALGLSVVLALMSGTAYGQCGARGHKPCAKKAKAAVKKRTAKSTKKVSGRSTSSKTAAIAVAPRERVGYIVMESVNTGGTGSGGAGSGADDSDPPPPAPPRPLNVPKVISGGVLNGRATSLPTPVYPPAARAVRAGGAVSVQVLVDENGSVISASAVSGNPLLRTAAVNAARQARFNPTKLSGQPVKVSGIVIYNFVP